MGHLDRKLIKLIKKTITGQITRKQFLKEISNPPLNQAYDFFKQSYSEIEQAVSRMTTAAKAIDKLEKASKKSAGTYPLSFSAQMQSLGHTVSKELDTPERSMLNVLILELLREGVPIQEIRSEFAVLGSSPLDSGISTEKAAIMMKDMSERLKRIREDKQMLIAVQEEIRREEERISDGAPTMGMGPTPGGGSGKDKTKNIAPILTPRI